MEVFFQYDQFKTNRDAPIPILTNSNSNQFQANNWNWNWCIPKNKHRRLKMMIDFY